MPRNYKKKIGLRGNKNYDEVYLLRAVAAVKQKRMSMRAASVQYGVPYSTLNDHVHDKVALKYGSPQALDENSERQLVEALLVCAEWGFPLKPIDVRYIVQQNLNKRGQTNKRFRDNLPGIDWFSAFMKRNPAVTVKLAENTKRVRAALSYETVKEYFDNLENTIKDVPASHIVNYDETNFVDNPGAAKVVLKKGSKHAFRTIDIVQKQIQL